MRQIILDTETTGLYPEQGHRIIELAAVEVIDRRPTGRTLHYRLDPEREIDTAATEVHGMTWDDLKGKPRFRDVAAEFLDFARGAAWIIHNAPFDIAFLDRELSECGLPCCASTHGELIDTLALARETFPGKRNSLDALCERFAVDNAQRTLHGALLDAQLLAEVYLAMTRGQESLTIDLAPAVPMIALGEGAGAELPTLRVALRVVPPSADELAAHLAYIETLEQETRGRCVWRALDAANADDAGDALPEAEQAAA